MRLVDELISGEWMQKVAKSAKCDLAYLATNQHINYLSEFNELFTSLTQKMAWEHSDYLAWEADLKSSPRLTIECLRALKSSWDREGYGVLEQGDWRSL
jgi:hypothetical protein